MSQPDREPAEVAARMERGVPLPDGPGERYAGYGVLGVSFRSGDVLALRRFPVTSNCCGYTSVWHRSRDGHWTFYSDVVAEKGCQRHFGPAVSQTVVAPIRIEWTGARSLEIAVAGGRLLAWSLVLAPTAATRLLNELARLMPARCWTNERMLAAVAAVARLALRAGPLRLSGLTPTGSRFVSSPQALWSVADSRATIQGRDLGRMGSIGAQHALGEFLIPRRPLFAVETSFTVMPP